MTKKNHTKRALISSAISLFLCFSMLVGTTFAWFTDSVSSTNNKIVAGNLDIELYYQNDETLEKDPNNGWVEVDENTNIFKEKTLWEPGHTEVVKFKIVNAGTLALKYQLGVNVAGEQGSTNVYDKEFKLSDYIKYSVISGEKNYSRDEAVKAAEENNATALSVDYQSATDTLAPEANKIVTMVVYMPETVGNEANAKKGAATPSINLGIHLRATQVEAEEDSFGPDYDKESVYADFVVTNADELVAALANAENGAVIGIKGNVTWATGAGIGSTPFIESVATFATTTPETDFHLTFVGMEAGATFTATGSGVGAIGIDNGTVTFKDLIIADKSESYAENSWEFGYLEFRGNTVFENCDIVNAIMMEGESATFKNCSFNSYKDSEYAVWVSEGNASFENCYFTGARGIKIHEAYGSKVDTVVVKNNEFADLTKKPALAIGDVDADTTVVIQNNMVAGAQAGDQGLYIYETDTEVTTFDFVCADNTVAGYADTNAELKDQLQNNATVVLPKGTFTIPTMSGKEGITIIGAADGSTIVGGENASTGFGSNFGKNTTIKNVTFTGSTNGVRSSYAQGGTSTFENCTFAGDSTYGFHIDESKGATFIFNNCTFSGFNAFAGDLEKVVFNNCTFLHNGNYGHTNIWSVAEFNNCTFGDRASVGTRGDNAHIFFNGVEESYYHEYIGSAESLFAFATSVNEGGNSWSGQKVSLVADIDLENKAWTPIGQTGATQFQGIFDGQGYTIKNLSIDSSAQTGANYSSGLFGWLNKATVKNVKVDGATVIGNHNVAVIAGYLETSGCTVSNCSVTNATVVAKHANDDACGDKVGVIVGHAGNAGVKVENCTAADSTVTAGRDAGQIVGAAITANVVNCTATNVTVTAGGDCTGANINNAVIGRVLG